MLGKILIQPVTTCNIFAPANIKCFDYRKDCKKMKTKMVLNSEEALLEPSAIMGNEEGIYFTF